MLQKVKISMLTLLATLSLSGCIVDTGSEDTQVYLRCRAVMSKNTRADGFSEVFPIAQDFSLWAYTLPRGKAWKEHSAEALPLAVAKHYVGNPADTIWYCADGENIEWPLTKTISFIACAPIEANGIYLPDKGICFNNYNALTDDYDLMYTDCIADHVRENNMRYISVPFSHALCKVDVKAKTILNTVTYTIKKITIKNLHYKGSFASLASPQWTTTDDVADYVIYDSPTGTQLQTLTTNTLQGAIKLLLPHTAVIEMEVEYTEKDLATGAVTPRTATTSSVTDTWLPGKYYTYTLEVKANGISFEEIRKEDITPSPQLSGGCENEI